MSRGGSFEESSVDEEASFDHHNNGHASPAERGELEMQPLRQLSSASFLSEEDDVLSEKKRSDGGLLLGKITEDYDSYFSSGWWERQLYPPHLPRACQLLRPENIAVPACYLLVGFLQGMSAPLANVLPIDLLASEAQQTTFTAIRSLPASFKILFGFLSDNFPIAGYRRKPYMLAGWLIASLSMASLNFFSNLNVTPLGASCFANLTGSAAETLEGHTQADVVPNNIPNNAPSIPFLAASILLFGFGFWMVSFFVVLFFANSRF